MTVDLDGDCGIIESKVGCLYYQGRLICLICTDKHLFDLLRERILVKFEVGLVEENCDTTLLDSDLTFWVFGLFEHAASNLRGDVNGYLLDVISK